jgi:hypothetical protein
MSWFATIKATIGRRVTLLNAARFTIAAAALVAMTSLHAAEPRVPTVKLSSTTRLVLPGDIDSSNPFVWDLVDGLPRLFVLTSWGGLPIQSSGASLDRLQRGALATFDPHPGHGVWMEAIVADAAGAWYGYYHHERPADECGRNDRQLPNIGAARSLDRGQTWRDLGVVIDAPPFSHACESGNRFVLGGVGDVTAALDASGQNLYLYFSQYARDPRAQGVAVARLAWADRDDPVGKVSIWNDGAWLPASRAPSDQAVDTWIYPAGTPLEPATKPFHDGSSSADVFWGASVHWNTYLEQYVMLLNRARDDQFNNEGIYVSFSTALDDPSRWSTPKKIMNGGGWYPQVVGLETGSGTDKLAGRRARFFLTGKSEQLIEFER